MSALAALDYERPELGDDRETLGIASPQRRSELTSTPFHRVRFRNRSAKSPPAPRRSRLLPGAF